MHIDLYVALAGLIVGFAVGLTGMGGGALMTPILVLVFGIAPLAAVSSDLVASLIMKPVGAAVHAGRGTVRWNLAGWLALGSVPSAFLGVIFVKSIGHGTRVQTIVSVALGAVLLLAVVRTGREDVPGPPQRHLARGGREAAHQEGADAGDRRDDRLHRRHHLGRARGRW